jgi:hypothetical protein
MTSDHQRYARYFDSRSTTLDLPPGDPSSVVARAAGRRRRRRTAVSGLTALAILAGVVTVQQVGDDGGSRVAAEGESQPVTASPLQWTSVTPSSGLLYSSGFAVTDDGTQYGLSTAPGRYDPDAPTGPLTLYRSTDGVEWTAVALPGDLWPSQLAARGGDLYAVGTSPAAGGNASATLARSTSGGEWTTADLPIDIGAIEDEIGAPVSVHGLDVSAGPDGTVVSLQLSTYVDALDYLPRPVDGAYTAGWTPTGIDVYGVPEGCQLVGQDLSCEDIEAVDAGAPMRAKPGRSPVLASFTFDEIGVGARMQSLLGGELHVFVTADGSAFEEAPLPDIAGDSASLVATDDGFVLFSTEWNGRENGVTVLRSADARTWTVDGGVATTGYVTSVGVIDGRAAAVLWTESGSVLVADQGNGSWSTLDLGDAISAQAPGAGIGIASADIGPLGAAIVLDAYDEGNQTSRWFTVFSPDGRSLSVQPIADLPGAANGYPASVRVSADAVTIAFGDARLDDGVITSTLLVGTPA